jgi:ribonuclease M5
MLEISKPIIVEGKYDKIKLSRVVKAHIVTTDGFGIFSKTEKTALIRRLAEANGVIVITDSDGAGLIIRNYIRNILPQSKVTHIYTPQIKGKEKRKAEPSKEGFLGVEGMELEWLEKTLAPFADGGVKPRMQLTKADMYALGLSGGPNSERRRRELSRLLQLPDNLSANALLEAICLLVTQEEFDRATEALSQI